VLGAKGMDRIPVTTSASPNLHNLPRLYLNDLDLEGDSLHSELDRLAEHLLRALGSVEAHRLGACLQSQRPDQPDHSEKMIGMKVGEKDLRQREAHPVAHHLALGALAALEQQRLAFAHEGQRGDVALYRRPSGRRTEKSDGEHGGEYKAAGAGSGSPEATAYFCRGGRPAARSQRPSTSLLPNA